MCFLVRHLTGCRLQDTQTGLRSFNGANAALFSDINVNGYDFEMAMVLRCIRHHIPIVECPIQTVYHANTSHFKLFRDSYQILKILLRKA
jgi:hypothetical protein